MAEFSSPTKKFKSSLIYVDNAKILKKRFLTIYNKAKEKGFNVTSEYSSDVGVVVTECAFVEQFLALKKICTDITGLDFVKTMWLSNCIQQGNITEILDEYRVPFKEAVNPQCCNPIDSFPEYECQRITPLKHCNAVFTQSLRILEREAVLKGDDQNNSRALAFRRGICTIASLKNPIRKLSDINGLPHIGKHIELLVQTGFSQEAKDIENSDWFKVVEVFEGVFGVGPATAQRWFNAGFRSIADVIQNPDIQNHKDNRLLYGLAFHEDLSLPVSRSEAVFWEKYVKTELAAVDPRASVTLTGGFSRGKDEGHDIDLLLSHPVPGEEAGLLSKLLVILAEDKDLIVYGKHEQSTYTENTITHKGAALKSSLDHYEKWLGIVKIPGKLPQTPNFPDIKPCKLQNILKETDAERVWVARRVDLILVPQHQMPFALLGWIGSRMFNRSIRRYAEKVMSMKLSSHGLYDLTTRKFLPAACEEDIFKHLKLDYKKPCDRNC